MRKKAKYFIFLVFTILFSCTKYPNTPKPKAYPYIERDSVYYLYEGNKFSFQYSASASVEEIIAEQKNGVWLNISYPKYNAKIHCTYVSVNNNLPQLMEDSYKLAYSHVSKAEGIKESLYTDTQSRSSGILYEIGGNVAAPIQFYITDSLSHFFRGSLYYNQQVSFDSIAPVTKYIREDIIRLMETMKWGTQK